jgi:methionine transaminase
MEKMPITISSKLHEVGTTIFTVMSQMASNYGAINLSQGFPDFPVDEELIRRVNHHMITGANQYAPMPGLASLREVIAKKVNTAYNSQIAPSQIVVTPGATSALYSAITAIVESGDEVLIFEPAYDSYAPAVKLQGGVPVYSQLSAPEFRPDWDQVKKLITQKTKLVIINTPHNPTGTVWTKDDWIELEKLAELFPFFVLSDEVYEHIIFEENHQSILRLPSLSERFAAVYSFGKTFHATGWKVGYVIAASNWVEEILKVHQFLNFSVHTPSQHALATFLSDANTYQSLPKMYRTKRDFFLEGIKNSPFTFIPSGGTYFQLLDYSGFSDSSDHELATQLTKEIGVASIPISSFYHDIKHAPKRFLRFCFAKKEETLIAAIDKLCKI